MAELYLVEFKGSRKGYFLNKFYHNLKDADYVVTQAERGEEIGRVIKKIDSEAGVSGEGRPKTILRPAGKEDMQLLEERNQRDNECRTEVIQTIRRHGLEMKVVDVETQLDGNKMTIYFTADHRVDFRNLVKELASCYKTRIELRQIGVRDEARRIGGFGVCGLKQCCNSFIKEFDPITTQHARDQDLPMNPAKISGNCGRLLCCLKFEVDSYREIKRLFPSPGTPVRTEEGDGVIQRIDIFNEEAIIRTEDGVTFRGRVGSFEIIDRKQAARDNPGGNSHGNGQRNNSEIGNRSQGDAPSG
ncbi:MAG: regulatory iron-sulfur-containing complex subunit RicT [bacterium]|nr:regulatory iron-sulfur-containing complex subunit RicT [bacterium]